MYTPLEIRTIGENRYWHTVAKKLNIAMLCSIAWAGICIGTVYMLGLVATEHTYTIKPYMLETYQSQEELTVTAENGNIYMEDFKLPEPSPKKDISIPFGIITLLPMTGTLVYMGYCHQKASQAGEDFLVEWMSQRTEVHN